MTARITSRCADCFGLELGPAVCGSCDGERFSITAKVDLTFVVWPTVLLRLSACVEVDRPASDQPAATPTRRDHPRTR